MYLQDENGHKAFFPDSSGNMFRFSSDVGHNIQTLIVKGAPQTANTLVLPATPDLPSVAGEQTSLTKYRPTFSTKLKGVVNVKIVKVLYLGKVQMAK